MKEAYQEIIAKAATGIVEDSIKAAWNKVKHYFEDSRIKDEIAYGSAYEDYLWNTKSKNSRIKTLIYRRVPKDLYSFYECVGVSFNEETIDTSDINNLLMVDSRIVVTGTGGIGKTTMLKHLYLNTIETTNYIPVLLELRSLNSYDIKDISVENAVFNNLVQNGFTLSKEYYEYSMMKGGYIVFLDGFDEINRDRISIVSNSIRAMCGKYNENKYIITSRPQDSFIGWNDFTEVQAQCLTKVQALNLINKIEFDETIKSRFSQDLNNFLFDKYESFASNPLLLTIMLLTYNDHAVFPERLNDFYEQAFFTLYNMHDATKEAYVRDIRTGLGCEDFKAVFSYFCFKSYFAGQFEFSENELHQHIQTAKARFPSLKFSVDDYLEDLLQSVCMLVKEGLSYRFSHRSFQEYFAALYTCKLEDETQKKLLAIWMGESSACLFDSYLQMLYNMQENKVKILVLAPGLKRIQTLYENGGCTVEFLKCFFYGIHVSEPTEFAPNGDLSFEINNRYLCNIVASTCKLNDYSFADADELTSECRETIIKLLPLQKNYFINLDVAVEAVGETEFLKCTEWFENQIIFVISILKQIRNDKIGNKRKVASILEEL